MPPRPYTDYPPRFTSIVEHFEQSHSNIEFSLIYREAIPIRQSFYRFTRALSVAESSGDEYAKKLNKTAKLISASVTPARADNPEDPAQLAFYINPLERGTTISETFSGSEDLIPLDPAELDSIIASKKND